MMHIFIPMTVWQALAFLRNRSEVIAQIITPDPRRKPRSPLAGELVVGDKLVAYHCAKHAIEAWRLDDKGEMALVDISFGERFHEKLCYEGKISGTPCDPRTGQALWVVTPGGCADLDREARFVMEVIPGEPEPAKAPAPVEFGGGPLGFGGC